MAFWDNETKFEDWLKAFLPGGGGSFTPTGDLGGTALSTVVQTVLGGQTPLTAAGNLAGIANTATARTNLGLGTAATMAASAFDAAGTATTAVAGEVTRADGAYVHQDGTGMPSYVTNAITALSTLGALVKGVSQIDVIGDSYPSGYKLTTPTSSRFGARLAQVLGATENNSALTGQQICRSGAILTGWPRIAQNFPRTPDAGVDFYPLPQSQFFISFTGANDLASLNPNGTPSGTKPGGGSWAGIRDKYLSMAYMHIISTAMAVARYEDTHSSIVYSTSQWTQNNVSSNFATGGTNHNTTTNGATATITLPSTMTTSTTVALIASSNSGSTGIFSVTKNGTAVGTIDTTDTSQAVVTNGFTSGNTFTFVLRVPNCNPGDTIVLTASAVAGSGPIFDCYLTEAPTVSLTPMVAVVGHPLLCGTAQVPGLSGLQGYGNWNNASPTPPYSIGDSDITAMNTTMSNVVGFYGNPNVFYVGTTSLDHDPTSYDPDDYVHPNLLGHMKIALSILNVANTISTYTPSNALFYSGLPLGTPLPDTQILLPAAGATPSINTGTYIRTVATITGLATAITGFNISGSPSEGYSLIINITDNGTARALTFGASFENSTITLPTTTVAGAKLTVGFLFNNATGLWRCVGVA